LHDGRAFGTLRRQFGGRGMASSASGIEQASRQAESMRLATTAMRRAVVSRVDIREWYVCTRDGETVGPVSTALVARGVSAGKVPCGALVARVGDSVWQPVLRVPEIMSALKLL
jgi:hypothetical protein